MRPRAASLALAAALAALAGGLSAGETVWIEGESPVRHSFDKHNWYDAVDKSVLSGREWLSHYNPAKAGEASYELQVRGGDYALWMRANYFRCEMRWRLDGGEWAAVDFTDARDKLMISDKPDHRFIGWVKLGRIKLPAGKHTLDFRIESKLANHGGIDCICVTDEPFVPSGTTRPGQAPAAGPSDWFPVVVDADDFSERSVIDVSSLVEKPAGKHGFLKRDGDGLRFENAPARAKFWGCGANLDESLSPEADSRRVRYLVKHGVNMVRQHPLFGCLGPLKGGELDRAKMDRYDRWFAELKKQGVYTTWSVFYPHHCPMLTGEDGYPAELFAELEKGPDGLGNVGGLINIERAMQDACLRYMKALLEHRNPYTGLAYKDDPALAVVEIQNEDCVFFHVPLNDLREGKKRPLHSAQFRRMWFDWAKARYGGEAALKAAWGRLMPGDSWAAGELEVMGAYHLGGDGPLYEFAGQIRRAADYIRFLTEMQRSYYDRREKELRQLGFRGVTVTTAWRAGGAAADAANLYCDTACDMIDRHNYFGGGAGGHGIRAGKVNKESHLSRPGSGILASGLYQVEGRPFAMTEWTQSPPNEWKAEIAPLVAFYGMGLQGWDASYHFTSSRSRLGDGWPDLNSYVTDTPHYIGQFPALAFAVYKGHVKEVPAAAARRLRVEDLFTGKDPLGQDFTGGGLDAKALKGDLATPAEVLAVGRITVAFDGRPPEKADWAKYWDQGAKTVRSMTGELVWDYGSRVVTVRSPKTQAVIGFAGGRSFDLPGAKVDVRTAFVSLIITPLDDVDLASSRHILVTAMARDKQTGTEYSEPGDELRSVGGPPLLMEPVQATIALKGAQPAEVNVLDFHGVPTGRKVPVAPGGAFTIDGTHRACYYEVKR